MNMRPVICGNGDAMCRDLDSEKCIELGNDARPIRFGYLPNGMISGEPSLGICLELPDGRHVLAQISVRDFLEVAALVRNLAKSEGFDL